MTFKIVEAWVEGTRPYLSNRATEEALSGSTRNNTPGTEQNPRDLCERGVYRIPNDGNQLAIPGAAFSRLLREAGGSHKSKGSRKSLKYLVPAAVLVLDDVCGAYLNDRLTPLTDYEVDSRPVTIPATKGRIMRYRARFNEWSCKVTIRIDESILSEATVRQLLIEGLVQIGIGDYRPEKGGPFGTAAVVSWITISEPKPLTPAQKRNGKPEDTEARLD
jgi:hypothetical protein